MGIANVINVTGSAGGGEIIRELINSSDGQGLHFDGAAGSIPFTPVDLGTKYSFEFVVKADSLSGAANANYLVAFQGGGNAIFGHNSGNLSFYSVGAWYSLGVNPLSDLKVHHIVLTIDGTTATVFDNGNQTGTVTIATSNIDSCSTAAIGSNAAGSAGFFNGSLYRARFYNKTLTQAEVDNAYQSVDIPFADEYGSETELSSASFTNSGFTGFSGSATGFTASGSANGNAAYKNQTFTDGKKFRIKFTVTDGESANLYFNFRTSSGGGGSNTGNIISSSKGVASSNALQATETGDYELIVDSLGSAASYRFVAAADVGAVNISGFSIVQIGAVSDYDLAFANPTQSLMVQDRAGVADGTSSATGVSQTQKIPQLNATAIAAGAGPVTPADNTIHLKAADGAYGIIHENASGVKVATYTGGSSAFIGTQGSHQMSIATAGSERLTVSSAGETKITRTGDEPCLELATDNAGCKLLFARGGDPTAYIRMYEDGSTGSGSLRFATGTSATPVERLKIDTAGLVTSTLSSADTNTAGVALKLDHTTSGSSAVGFGTLIRFDGERTGSTSDGMGTMGFVADSMSASRVDGAFVVNTGQDGSYTERLRISSTGDVNIGSGSTTGGNLYINDDEDTVFDASQGSHQRDEGATLNIHNDSETVNSFSQIVLRNRASSVGGCRIASISNGANSSDLAIVTGDTGEKMRVSAAGNLGVGSGADIGGSGVATFTAAEKIEMRAAGAESPQFLASCYSTTSSRCASIAFQKSHTNTGGTNSATVDTENLGRIMFRGVSSGDGARDSAEIAAVCDGAPDGSDQPAKLVFKTSSTSETLGTRLTIGPTGLATFADGVTVSGGFTTLGGFNDLTIASGAVTATSSTHNIDTEGGGATDYLDTINGGSTGSIITLMAASGSRTVVVEDGTNLKLAGDCTLDNAEDTITLIKSGSAWHEVSRSNNGA